MNGISMNIFEEWKTMPDDDKRKVVIKHFERLGQPVPDDVTIDGFISMTEHAFLFEGQGIQTGAEETLRIIMGKNLESEEEESGK